jgi:hypothetical protein
MATLNLKWLVMIAALSVGATLTTSCTNENEPELIPESPSVYSRIPANPYVGVWASSRFIEAAGDDYVMAHELREDGTASDGIWYFDTEEFVPEDYVWDWYVEDGKFCIVDGGYTLTRTVEFDDENTTYTLYDDDDPRTRHKETYIKLR